MLSPSEVPASHWFQRAYTTAAPTIPPPFASPDTVEQIAEHLIDAFHDLAHAFYGETSSALHRYKHELSMPQTDMDAIGAAHSRVLLEFRAILPCLNGLRAAIPEARHPTLIDLRPRYQEALHVLEMANHMVDILNDPQKLQRFRDSTPEQEDFIRQYHDLRLSWAQSCFEKVSTQESAIAELDGDELLTAVSDVLAECDTSEEAMKLRAEILWEKIMPSLHIYIETGQPFMQDVDDLESAILRTAHRLAQRVFAITGDPDANAEFKVWSTGDFEDLKRSLVDLQRARHHDDEVAPLENTILEQTQLLDNKCHICLEKYNEPTRVSTRCKHIFCFRCIVPWVDRNGECAKCRSTAALDDLALLDVELSSAENNEGDAGGSEEKMKQYTDDQEDPELIDMMEKQEKLEQDLNVAIERLRNFHAS